MCDFGDWTATGVVMEASSHADLSGKKSLQTGASVWLTLVGAGTCPQEGWHHAIVRANGGGVDDPKLEVFEVDRTPPGAEPADADVVATVDWSGLANPPAEKVEIRNARSDGGSVVVAIRLIFSGWPFIADPLETVAAGILL